MRNLFLIFLLFFVILSQSAESLSQTTSADKKPCRPSAEEILSAIQNSYKLTLSPEEILIAGEINIGWWKYSSKVEKVPLNRVFGEFGRRREVSILFGSPIFIIRQFPGEPPKLRLEIQSGFDKELIERNIILEKGDIVFVSRGCGIDGKLMPPSNSGFPRFPPNGTDEPIKLPKRKISAK